MAKQNRGLDTFAKWNILSNTSTLIKGSFSKVWTKVKVFDIGKRNWNQIGHAQLANSDRLNAENLFYFFKQR